MKHRETAVVQQRPVVASQSSAQNRWTDRLNNSAVLFGIVPVGSALGRWISKLVALPQLRSLVDGSIPWTRLSKPLSRCKVVLISTGGVHLRHDKPFHVDGDASYRVIPNNARVAELAISHQAYDKTDALRDINLVFPIERLRELAVEGVIGSLADEHYGFGLMGSARELLPAQKDVAKRIRDAGVDLALLVPA